MESNRSIVVIAITVINSETCFFRELFEAPFVILVCDEKHSEKDQDAHHLEL